jgi:anaerobic selenocysteine-containing dehydrogenase
MNQTSRAPGAAVGKTEIRQTTCYMCACRCGINVHMAEGKVHYIEGNRDHPINKGVLCAKGSAGIMQHYSPARLKKPLLRTGERGSGEFREIEWDEALELATQLAWQGSQHRSAQTCLFHGARPEPVNDRLVGAGVWHAELCRPWRLLLGQHGSCRHLHDGRRLLGVRRAGLGEAPSCS